MDRARLAEIRRGREMERYRESRREERDDRNDNNMD
jgi:hypothetical protein